VSECNQRVSSSRFVIFDELKTIKKKQKKKKRINKIKSTSELERERE
jgi:hypothetical protein